jgi:DNA-binding NarL/FixJ family response regulator
VLVGSGDERSRDAISALVARLGLSTETVDTGVEVLAAASRRAPALVVVSVELTNPTAFEVCQELRSQFGEGLPIVLVAGAHSGPRDEIAGLLLGADDYFSIPLREDRFVARLRRLLTRAPARPAPSRLTSREREVLTLLVDGRRPSEIAEQLCITRKTASTHIEHILSKLSAHSQAQAVAFAIREGIVDRTTRTPG